MTRNVTLGVAFVLATSLTALAETRWPEAWRTATSRIETGERRLASLRTAGTNARRLDALDQAISSFKAARRTATERKKHDLENLREAAERGLVKAYGAKAEILLSRGSLANAREAAILALDLDPRDPVALNLFFRIDAEAGTDVFAKYQGSAAIERIRARRAASGTPLRPRGVTGRR